MRLVAELSVFSKVRVADPKITSDEVDDGICLQLKICAAALRAMYPIRKVLQTFVMLHIPL